MKNHMLRAFREIFNLSLEDMGKVIGLTATGYRNKEQGTRSLTQEEMIRITDFLKRYDESLTMDKIFYIDMIHIESKHDIETA